MAEVESVGRLTVVSQASFTILAQRTTPQGCLLARIIRRLPLWSTLDVRAVRPIQGMQALHERKVIEDVVLPASVMEILPTQI